MNLIECAENLYPNDPCELIGRHMTNALGAEEIVTMRRIQWDYFDWLEGHCVDMIRFVYECEMSNPNSSLSDALQCWIYDAFVLRERKGHERPNWLEPLLE